MSPEDSARSNNSVSGNNIANYWLGILLDSSSNNTIYHDNLINKHGQVYSSGSTNVWDDGYPSGGNYWSDYNGSDLRSGPYQNQTGSDGVGDTPYVVDNYNTDRFPLMNPVTTPETSTWNGALAVTVILVILILATLTATILLKKNRKPKTQLQPARDVDNDGKVDGKDIALVALHFGQAGP